jgi:hypothetical protein
VDKRSTLLYGFGDPMEGDGVILGGIGTHDENNISITDVCPMIGHCPPTETFRQTGDS